MKHRAPDGRSGATDDTRPGDEDFLQRWSRLKDAAREPQDHPPAAPTPAQDPVPLPDEVPEPELTDADMPPLETLGPDSDFSPFLSGGVSEKLRKLALRKLFQLPHFNIRDGLDDYDEDFTVFEPLGDIVTADMKHRQERREAREQAEREHELAHEQTTREDTVATSDAVDEPDTQAATQSSHTTADANEQGDSGPRADEPADPDDTSVDPPNGKGPV